MQRINSTRLGVQATSFDPLAIVRGAGLGSAIVAPIAEGMGAVAQKKIALEDRDAQLFARIEGSRIERELGADLNGVRNAMPESGAGYAKLAQEAAQRRQYEALARAGGDEKKVKALEEAFALESEDRRRVFEAGERDYSKAYALNQHGLAFDNAQQEIARSPSGVSKYDPTGVSASAASALARLEAVSGKSFKVNSAYRSPSRNRTAGGAKKSQHMHGNAFDIDVSGMPIEERKVLIAQAKSVGFGGVGVYDNALHFDVADERAWGPDFHGGSLPEWAADVVKAPRGAAPAGVDQNGLPLYVGDAPDIYKNPVVAAHRDDLHSQIDLLSITKAEKSELKRRVDGGLVSSALQRMGEENPSAALAALRSGAYDDALSYDDDARMQGALSKQIEQDITAQAKNQLSAMKDAAAAMVGDVVSWQNSGRAGEAPPQITPEQLALLPQSQQDAYAQSVAVGDAVSGARNIDVSNADAYLESIKPAGQGFEFETKAYEAAQVVIKKRKEEAVTEAHVAGSLAAGVPPDLGVVGVKEKIEAQFDVALGNGQNPFGAASEFIASRKIAPPRFGGMVAQAMGSEDHAVVMQAVEAVARLNAVDPRLLADAPNGKAIDRAAAVAKWMDMGLSPKDALAHTAAMIDPSKSGEIKARAGLWTADKAVMEKAAHEAFTDRLEARGKAMGLGSGDASAAIPPSVWGEYSDLVKEQYAVSGNVDVAVAVAERAFYASHAVTRVGGVPQWQKGAPEAVYRVWGDARDSAWLEDQAVTFASEALGLDVKSVTLRPIDDGRRVAAVGYAAIATTADGKVLPVPSVFKPDVASERALATSVIGAGDKVQKATLELRQLQVDAAVVLDRIYSAGVSADPKEIEAARAEFRGMQAAIEAARKRRDGLKGELKALTVKPAEFVENSGLQIAP